MTVKDPAGLAWFLHHMLLTLLGQGLVEILSENKESWLRKWILRREQRVALSKKTCDLGVFKRQTGQRLTISFKGKSRKI